MGPPTLRPKTLGTSQRLEDPFIKEYTLNQSRMPHTCSLHCSSFLGLPYRILIIYLVKPEKGTTMETIGMM